MREKKVIKVKKVGIKIGSSFTIKCYKATQKIPWRFGQNGEKKDDKTY